ncbi:hypothetical protein FVW20_00280 [Desulfovibrio oxamicus]|uniref:Head-tail joining protein n=1 Tax=Nitratidesulfovibrio oxamicus TaxID=32016 RepID=A0ABS0IZ96_9BACT|nr:hypothetical protein [Nitratidesulfovibrio oxamicus]MBG3875501.1 hypothetical protein [Nitratidesulfovibrio oxamicus]
MSLRARVRADAARIFAGGFADPVTFLPLGGDPVTVRGIWKEGEQLVDAGDYMQVSSSAITVTILRTSLPQLPVIEEDRVQFEGAEYTVADVTPKHPNMLEVRLHRRPA